MESPKLLGYPLYKFLLHVVGDFVHFAKLFKSWARLWHTTLLQELRVDLAHVADNVVSSFGPLVVNKFGHVSYSTRILLTLVLTVIAVNVIVPGTQATSAPTSRASVETVRGVGSPEKSSVAAPRPPTFAVVIVPEVFYATEPPVAFKVVIAPLP